MTERPLGQIIERGQTGTLWQPFLQAFATRGTKWGTSWPEGSETHESETQIIVERWVSRDIHPEETLSGDLAERLAAFDRRIEALERWQTSPIQLLRDGAPVVIRQSVPDDVAIEEIRGFLRGAAAEGADRMGLLDLVAELALPPEQVRRLMSSLSSEGVEPIE